jgi:hypothetical protein
MGCHRVDRYLAAGCEEKGGSENVDGPMDEARRNGRIFRAPIDHVFFM